VHTTKEALDLGMDQVLPGNTVYDYAHVVQHHVESQGCKIIEKLTGHGVGVKVHEQPYIHNYPHPDTKRIKFLPGMVLAFEPITAIISDDFTQKRGNDRNLYTKK
jgi:methionyl aminopeptidase